MFENLLIFHTRKDSAQNRVPTLNYNKDIVIFLIALRKFGNCYYKIASPNKYSLKNDMNSIFTIVASAAFIKRFFFTSDLCVH